MDGMLSQDEINALLSGDPIDDDSNEAVQASTRAVAEELLTESEKDAIGEVANISMGTSATTLYSLVNHKVEITTPVVQLAVWQDVLDCYEKPCVFIEIKYTTGLDGHNILILKEHDVKVIADLMMGGDGTNTEVELGELHLSAISEAMNQMMGSAATSMSQMLGTTIDISPPEANHIDILEIKQGDEISPFLGGTFVKIAFRMQIGDLVDSNILQLYPVDFAKNLVATFMEGMSGGHSAATAAATPPPAPEPVPYVPPTVNPGQAAGMNNMGMGPAGMMGMQPMNMMGMQPMGMMGMQPEAMQNYNYQPAQFTNFAPNVNPVMSSENINLIMDVPLQVTVELGRTNKSISEILEFSPGTIIELDKIAGEPVDVLVNGKFVAKGEVVVIEESFGIRVTEIIK